MTVGAHGPRPLVFPGVDRKILAVMVKGGGLPCRGAVARLAVGTELGCRMRGIICLIIGLLVTSHTGVGRYIIVAVMTLVAGCRCMCSVSAQ